jgi:hypothetical protein
MLLTFAVCLLCWFLSYADSAAFPSVREQATNGPLWPFAERLITNRTVACLVVLFILLFVAYMMQRISAMEMLIRVRTRLPFMLIMLLISTNRTLPTVGEGIVLLCFIVAVCELFRTYQSPEQRGCFFNTGVLIGVGGLFMPPVLSFLPLLWIGMYQFRSLNFRGLMASLTGTLIVYWFALGWCVWKHDFSIFQSLYNGWTDIQPMTLDVYDQAGPFVTFIIFVAAFLHNKIDVFNNSVRVRRMHSFLLNMAVWMFVLVLLYGRNTVLFQAAMCLPASVIIACFFENIRRVFGFVLYYFLLLTCLTSFLLRVWTF